LKIRIAISVLAGNASNIPLIFVCISSVDEENKLETKTVMINTTGIVLFNINNYALLILNYIC